MRQFAAGVNAYLSNWQTRWRAMPLRDRRALSALSVFLLGSIAWLFVVEPVLLYAEESRVELEKARTDLAWMQANAVAARQAGAQGGGHLAEGQSLLSAVNASARDSGLNLQRFEPDGDQRVRVTLENAVFTDVMRWIVLLQAQYGLGVESFNADPQAQPGVVNIRLTLGRSA